MALCARCGHQFDEAARNTCPICYTPVGQAPAAPQPGAPQPGQPMAQPGYAPNPGQQMPPQGYAPNPGMPGSPMAPPQSGGPSALAPGARVSLTGEVIEAQPSGPPPGYVGGGPAGGVARAQPTPAQRMAAKAPEPVVSSGSAVKIVLVLLVLFGGAGGGWWFWNHRTNPKDNARAFITAMASKDWKAVYELVELPESSKAKAPDATTFAALVDAQITSAGSNPLMAAGIDAYFDSLKTAKIGEPTITGNTATVPVTTTMTVLGQSKTSDSKMEMKLVGGKWVVDGGSGGAGSPGAMVGSTIK